MEKNAQVAASYSQLTGGAACYKLARADSSLFERGNKRQASVGEKKEEDTELGVGRMQQYCSSTIAYSYSQRRSVSDASSLLPPLSKSVVAPCVACLPALLGVCPLDQCCFKARDDLENIYKRRKTYPSQFTPHLL